MQFFFLPPFSRLENSSFRFSGVFPRTYFERKICLEHHNKIHILLWHTEQKFVSFSLDVVRHRAELRLRIAKKHASNHHSLTIWLCRRGKFVCALLSHSTAWITIPKKKCKQTNTRPRKKYKNPHFQQSFYILRFDCKHWHVLKKMHWLRKWYTFFS